MSVFIDGSTLSSLLYSHSNSAGNQEGLLLGQIVSHVKDHISDSQINTSQVQTFMYVSSHIPWPNEDRVYSRGGVPIMEKMATLLGDNHVKEEVIGWYRCRRNSTLRMSMKERTLHKHLEGRFCPQKNEHFLFFMCVDTASAQCSTHSLDHCFFTVSGGPGAVKKIGMSVTNLGDTLHMQYRTHASPTVSQSPAVKNILYEFRSKFVSSSEQMGEVQKIDDMSHALNSNLLRLCKQVAESEHRAGELEREVLQLKEELMQREMQRQKEELTHREAQQRVVERQLESSTDTGHLYPSLPVTESSLSDDVGWDATGVQAPVEERLVVNLGQASVDKCSPALEAQPSVDTLLSLSVPPSACDDVGLQPVLPSTSASPPPSYSASSTTKPDSTAAVLQSVVDTITDTDEEEGLGTTNHSHTKSLPTPSDKAGHRGHCNPNNAIKAGHDGAPGSPQLGADQTTVAANSSTSKDHFSFVDNLLSTDSGLPHNKTATVPTGATITYSPRTTRSNTKGNASSAKASTKEKSKPRNTQMSSLETRSKMVVSASKHEEPAPKTTSAPSSTSSMPTTGSEKMQIKGDGNIWARGKVEVSPRESASPKEEHSDSSCSGSRSRLKLDPANFELGSYHRKRAQGATGRKGAKNSTHGEAAECEMRENGNAGFVQGVENDVCRSSSPIY